jgi:hypothetical protein
MAKSDFFTINGSYLEVPENLWENAAQAEKILIGYNNMHLLNIETKSFKLFPIV